MIAELGIHKLAAAFHPAIFAVFIPQQTQGYPVFRQFLMDVREVRHGILPAYRPFSKQSLFQQPVSHGVRKGPVYIQFFRPAEDTPDGIARAFKSHGNKTVTNSLAMNPQDLTILGHMRPPKRDVAPLGMGT
jgi:hypothetical protein